ncbi:MAG: methyltransferase domain-containing protein [Thermoplasmata archaeon]|jgi:ubiquinone/menaquinone biosynthesis C-methylase UbiE
MYSQRESLANARRGPRFRWYHFLRELDRIHRHRPIDSLLEISAGNGVNLALAHDRLGISKCLATDIVFRPADMPMFIEYARLEVTELGSWLPAASVSVTMMIEVLEPVWDPDATIEAVYRVIRPGGYLVLTTPNLSSLVNRFALLLGFQPLGTEVSTRRTFGNPGPKQVAGHLRIFTYKALKEFVRFYGFRIERAYTSALGGGLADESAIAPDHGLGAARLARWVVRVDDLASRIDRGWGSDCIFVLRKPE